MYPINILQDVPKKRNNNKAIVDCTSPALCTPVTPFPADPIFSERGSDGMIPCAA